MPFLDGEVSLLEKGAGLEKPCMRTPLHLLFQADVLLKTKRGK
jgi:hypothetical protein